MAFFNPTPAPQAPGAGQVADENCYSLYLQATMVRGGSGPVFRNGDVQPFIGILQSATPCKIKSEGTNAVRLGDLDLVARAASEDGDDAVRIVLTDITSSETLTIIYDSGAITAAEDQVLNSETGDNASGNDTLVITAENSNGETGGDPADEIVVSVDADKNLIITPGANITGTRLYTIERLNDVQAVEALGAEASDSDDVTAFQALLAKYAVGGNYGGFVGSDPNSPPDTDVNGAWIGWVLNMIGDNIATTYSDRIFIPPQSVGSTWGATGTNAVDVVRNVNEAGVVVIPGSTPAGGALTRSLNTNLILSAVFRNWGSADREAAAADVREAIYTDPPRTWEEVVGGFGWVGASVANLRSCSAPGCGPTGPICDDTGLCGICGPQPRNTFIAWDGDYVYDGVTGHWCIFSCVDPCQISNGICVCLTGCTPIRAAVWYERTWHAAYEENYNI